jgi:hypothetical protein
MRTLTERPKERTDYFEDRRLAALLAFPENPCHRLAKDYKLVRDAVSDPVADARLAGRVFVEPWEEFAGRDRNPALCVLL